MGMLQCIECMCGGLAGRYVSEGSLQHQAFLIVRDDCMDWGTTGKMHS